MSRSKKELDQSFDNQISKQHKLSRREALIVIGLTAIGIPITYILYLLQKNKSWFTETDVEPAILKSPTPTFQPQAFESTQQQYQQLEQETLNVVTFEGYSNFGTEIYYADNIQALSNWFRVEEASHGIDVVNDSADDIRRVIESFRPIEPRKMLYIINQTLWDAIIAEGATHIGTNDPATAIEAYMHVQNQMLIDAGIASQIEISAIVRMPDSELDGNMYTYGADANGYWNPENQNKWVNTVVKSNGTQFTTPPLWADYTMFFSSITPTDWFLCKGPFIDSGKFVTITINNSVTSVKVRGDIIHETFSHPFYKLPDLYYENFDIAMITDYNSQTGPKVYVFPECNMTSLLSFNFSYLILQDIISNIEKDAQKVGTPNRNSITHGLGYIYTPYQPPEFDFPVELTDTVYPRRADFIVKYNGNTITDQITNAWFFPNTNSPGIGFNPFYAQDPEYGSGEEPPLTLNATRFDWWVVGGPGGVFTPEHFVINFRAFAYKIGSYKLPIPMSVYRHLGKNEKQYADNDRIPINTITLVHEPSSFQMPDLFYVQLSQGYKVPPDPSDSSKTHPAIFAYMKLDTGDNKTYLLWTDAVLDPAELNTYDEIDLTHNLYLPVLMRAQNYGTQASNIKIDLPKILISPETIEQGIKDLQLFRQMYPRDIFEEKKRIK